MKDIEREQLLIRQYLLGELDEQQREQLEQRVITNPDYKEQVLITEEELLEDFVNGSLPPRELELVRQKYSSSPSLSRKVEIARTLNKYASAHPILSQRSVPQRTWATSLLEFFTGRNRFRQLSLAVLALFVVGGAVLAYWLLSRESRATYAALIQLNGPESQILPADDSVAAISLSPLLLRGSGETRTITITQQTRMVQLRLPDSSAGRATAFRALLKNVAGTEIFNLDDLRTRQLDQSPVLVLQIPVEMLKYDDYQLEISEKKPDGSYENPRTYFFSVRESR